MTFLENLQGAREGHWVEKVNLKTLSLLWTIRKLLLTI